MAIFGDQYPNKFRDRPDEFVVDPELVLKPVDLETPLNPQSIFGRTAPLGLEIGTGRGRFLIELASLNPQMDFLGLEYRLKRTNIVARKVRRQKLTNIRLIWTEAKLFLEQSIGPGTLDQIYINFPDPWPKRRHRRRRLLQQSFVDRVSDWLKPGGCLTFATDFTPYADQVVEILESDARFRSALQSPSVRDRLDDYPSTEFELMFRAQGKLLHFMRFQRMESGLSRPDEPAVVSGLSHPDEPRSSQENTPCTETTRPPQGPLSDQS